MLKKKFFFENINKRSQLLTLIIFFLNYKIDFLLLLLHYANVVFFLSNIYQHIKKTPASQR